MQSSSLAKFLRLNWRERVRLGEAMGYLTAAQIVLIFIPFNRIAPCLGARHAQSPATFSTPLQRAQAKRIGWAVTTMSRWVPWDSPCLVQALGARWMLGRCRLASTLYLGVAYDENQKMLAHAWLRCGDFIVTGAPQHQRFTVVATFADRRSNV